jgi:hypothetical protein
VQIHGVKISSEHARADQGLILLREAAEDEIDRIIFA